MEVAYEDIRRAFLHFVEHKDTQGRPFFIAGHSQGWTLWTLWTSVKVFPGNTVQSLDLGPKKTMDLGPNLFSFVSLRIPLLNP